MTKRERAKPPEIVDISRTDEDLQDFARRIAQRDALNASLAADAQTNTTMRVMHGPRPPTKHEDALLDAVKRELSSLHQCLVTILWDGKVKTYDQLAQAWGEKAASDESIRKEIGRLGESLVMQMAFKGLHVRKGKRGSKQAWLVKPEEGGRK